MDKELEKVRIVSDVLKESCTNEELRWYLQDLISRAKKQFSDDLIPKLNKAVPRGVSPYYDRIQKIIKEIIEKTKKQDG